MSGDAAKRRRAIALILSGVFPGLGQFYNRQPGKGVLFLVVGVVLIGSLGRALPPDPLELVQQGISPAALLLVLALLAVSLWSVADAWRIAGR